LCEDDQRRGEKRRGRSLFVYRDVDAVIQRLIPRPLAPSIAIELQVQVRCAFVLIAMKLATDSHKLTSRLVRRPHSKTIHRQSSPASIERAHAILKGLRVRGTAARLAVLAHMLAAPGPESHSDVSEALQPQGFDSATIYRNLIELAKLGVLSRVDLGDHRWRFEKTGNRRAGRSTHPHFICNDCGSVSCLDDADVTLSSRRGIAKDRVAEVSAITLKGRCRSC